MTDNETRATGSMPVLDWFLSLFVNKYKRRIEVARWKVNIALAEIEKKLQHGDMDSYPFELQSKYLLLSKIQLLDSLLKGNEVRF